MACVGRSYTTVVKASIMSRSARVVHAASCAAARLLLLLHLQASSVIFPSALPSPSLTSSVTGRVPLCACAPSFRLSSPAVPCRHRWCFPANCTQFVMPFVWRLLWANRGTPALLCVHGVDSVPSWLCSSAASPVTKSLQFTKWCARIIYTHCFIFCGFVFKIPEPFTQEKDLVWYCYAEHTYWK